MIRFYLLGLAAAAAFWGVARFVASYYELVDFRSQTLQQSAINDVQINAAEKQLSNEVTNIQTGLDAAVERINDEYSAALADRVHNHSASSGVQVPTAPATSGPAQRAKATGPSAKGQAIPQGQLIERLSRCEARVLYEAKEYDILATHYNALLSIYQQSQEVINGKQEDSGRKGDQGQKGH